MKTIISLSATQVSVVLFKGNVERLVQALCKNFSTDVERDIWRGAPTFKLDNPSVKLEDAHKLVRQAVKSVSSTPFQIDNRGDDSFNLYLSYNGIGLSLKGKVVEGYVVEKSMVLHLN